jgi:hypothetical protein
MDRSDALILTEHGPPANSVDREDGNYDARCANCGVDGCSEASGCMVFVGLRERRTYHRAAAA